MASFDWNKIEVVVTTTLGNVTSHISSGQEMAFAMSNFCIPISVRSICDCL
jgi:hypothetical protein